VACFIGFESILCYGEEARSMWAMIRAVFAALLLLGVFYTLGAWALSVYVGPDHIVDAARANPELPIQIMVEVTGIFGPMFGTLGRILLVTSLLAGLMSFQAAGSRYLFAFGRDGVLPAALARTGTVDSKSRDTPVTGSVVQSAVTAVVIAGFAVAGAHPIAHLFTWLAAIAAMAILLALIAAAGAAIRYFREGGGTQESAFTRLVAPTAGVVLGGGVLITTFLNSSALLGAEPGSPLTVIIPGVVGAAVVAGLVWAAILSAGGAEAYERIAADRPDPLSTPDERLKEIEI
jgi:amino acid permease